MAVTAYWYGNAFKAAFNAEIDLDTDTIKVALCSSSYTPNQDTHDYFNDVTNELSNGNGYTSGGATLGTKSVTYTGGTNTLAFDAADTAWTTFTGTARYAVIYKSTGTASTSPLIAYVDFGGDVSVTSGTFTITWAAGGIVTVTVS